MFIKYIDCYNFEMNLNKRWINGIKENVINYRI